ncbi:MAG: PilZ domain-containing protein [Hyphomicrobiaceae bacterium]|nr:PilZ domain-containing protein [Hyphomicrobiaceae bacterium]
MAPSSIARETKIIPPAYASEDYLGMLLLARTVYDSRTEAHPEIAPPRRFALLVALNSEVVHVAMLAAISCSVANALAAGDGQVEPRTLVRYFPSGSSRLTLAMLRLRRMDPAGEVSETLSAFHESLAVATQTTLTFLMDRNGPNASRNVGDLASDWRRACHSASRVIDAISDELGRLGLGLPHDCLSPLRSALAQSAAGQTPLVGDAGQPVVPHWGELRQSPRLDVDGRGILVARGVRHEIAIRDVSAGGLGIVDTIGLEEGESIVVIIDQSIVMNGRIAWAAKGFAGIAFDVPLFDDTPELKFLAAAANQV